ncbi:cytochrome c-type biogenesis protein CcmH [Psychromonas sp. RZ22]|uniref:cytochrome c-type biogenesis protein n=1 Tax=Psychromonas algarum TaxID=2555643 RepID=UPI001067B2AB|nr:cytochrome c-type biogenesis protein [Psychromonas sp. RZ22]TEW56717.1 cytochrome c-type biogenesis protein CcmH [Psychromonas sp. RZ22]
MTLLNHVLSLTALLLLLSFMLFSHNSHAAIETFDFDNAQQEQTFHDLTKILRCPKCQNQNISDSNAELAKDLRDKTYELVMQGKSEDEVVDYMVARYGNFVRYDPPMTPATIFLWLGPLLFIIFGLLVLFRQIKKQPAKETNLDDQEQQKLQQLLKQHAKDKKS